MIVCHEYKFIFLKTRKTAGTSIEAALAPLCGPSDIITPISPKDEPLRGADAGPRNYRGPFNPLPELFVPGCDKTRTIRDAWRGRKYFNHMSAVQIRNRIGRGTWDSYFKFCFERNPWDKVVSLFFYENQNKQAPMTWSEFLLEGKFASDLSRYSIDGEPAMDFVGQYEQLESDLAGVLERLGIDAPVDLPNAKSGLRNEKASYHENYNDKDRALIAEAFRGEIDLFGYEF